MLPEKALKPAIQQWCPPQVELFAEPETNTPQPQHLDEPELPDQPQHSQRNRRPPNYYRPDARGRA